MSKSHKMFHLAAKTHKSMFDNYEIRVIVGSFNSYQANCYFFQKHVFAKKNERMYFQGRNCCTFSEWQKKQ